MRLSERVRDEQFDGIVDEPTPADNRPFRPASYFLTTFYFLLFTFYFPTGYASSTENTRKVYENVDSWPFLKNWVHALYSPERGR